MSSNTGQIRIACKHRPCEFDITASVTQVEEEGRQMVRVAVRVLTGGITKTTEMNLVPETMPAEEFKAPF
jgi:hypothetical protein